MKYTPHTADDIAAMLAAIGVDSLDRLFEDIPAGLRLTRPLDLPPAISEPELLEEMKSIADRNTFVPQSCSFMGAGSNRHFIPCIVDHLLSRSEFYTAYTPYQPEISQGTLQSIFEFQSLITFLTGMEVANASMYDGASATAEACLMAMRLTRHKKVLISAGLHPFYRTVVETYLRHQGAAIEILPLGVDGFDSPEELQGHLDKDTAALVTQYPNFFGIVGNQSPLAAQLHTSQALLITAVAEPVALGLLTPPGEMDADIVAGDAQSFGIPVQFGGPYVGFLATRQDFMRQMPGRLIGETVDSDGRRGFVLTLSTREQHIRREKATSNICTNQGLCALAATISMTVLGKTGLRKLAELNFNKTEYAKKRLRESGLVKFPYVGSTFNEFVIELPFDGHQFNSFLRERGLAGGVVLSDHFPNMAGRILLSVTEVNPKAEIDRLVEAIDAFKE